MMDEVPCTATGLQLLRRLNRLAARLLDNDLPASQGRRLAVTLDEITVRDRRQAALNRAVDILDAGQGQSRWALGAGARIGLGAV